MLRCAFSLLLTRTRSVPGTRPGEQSSRHECSHLRPYLLSVPALLRPAKSDTSRLPMYSTEAACAPPASVEAVPGLFVRCPSAAARPPASIPDPYRARASFSDRLGSRSSIIVADLKQYLPSPTIEGSAAAAVAAGLEGGGELKKEDDVGAGKEGVGAVTTDEERNRKALEKIVAGVLVRFTLSSPLLSES